MRDEVMGDRNKLLNKEFLVLCSTPSIVWVIRSRKMRLDAYRNLVGKTERRRPVGSS
jgi:hypothetical protein